jgi:hypothetical protein
MYVSCLFTYYVAPEIYSSGNHHHHQQQQQQQQKQQQRCLVENTVTISYLFVWQNSVIRTQQM